MTSAKLPLENFVKLSGLMNADKFKSMDTLDYLGKSLVEWLDSLLDELGVASDPVIRGTVSGSAWIEGRVFVAEGATVEHGAYVQGPCYIGPGAEIRHGAYIRGNVYVGSKSVVGHTSEVKGSVLLDGAKAAHFAYVGDSFLGRSVNLGAGTKLANLKLKGGEVRFRDPVSKKSMASGLRKFGAILGDEAQTGCNAVLSPGTLMLPGATIMPCAHGHGLITGK